MVVLFHSYVPSASGVSVGILNAETLRSSIDILSPREVIAWVAHASRVLVSASSRSRTFPGNSHSSPERKSKGKPVSARRRNQHARRVRYPEHGRTKSFLVRQITFDRLFEGLFDHVTEVRLAFDHRFHEFDGLLETNMRRQSRHFRIGDCFENDWA